MSQMIEGPRKTFIASETAGPNLRWYVSDASTSPPTVSIAGAANPSVGVNEAAVLVALDRVALLLVNAQGTRKAVASGAITGGNNVYAAADGEVASSGTILEGTALETVTADQDILEVLTTLGVDLDWSDAVANAAGVGITDTADNFVTSVEKIGSIIKTTILIEVDGLNSGGTAADIVGADGAGVAHLGQITAAVNGTIFAGKITCLETPTGGDPDIDLWYADEATGVEDTAISALTGEIQCINHGDWTGAQLDVLTAFPAADKYLYLTTGAATDATYTAGILLIELFGVAA